MNTWYAPSAFSAGTIITLDGSFFPGGTLAIQGDQLLAFQGTIASPTFLAGIHSNSEAGVTNDVDWDGASVNNDESALPDQLTNGVNALRVHAMEAEVDNWQIDCSSLPPGSLTGSKQQIAALINNIQYWVNNDATEFSPTVHPACIFTIMVDNTPPNVTIEQATAQADPTATSPINFTVVFNEPVTDFITGDVTLSGTANPTTADVTEIAPNDGTTYNVAVSGMTGDGTVNAIVSAGVAQDLGGNPNTPSTSTDNEITYDATAPTLLSIERFNPMTSLTNADNLAWTLTFSEVISGTIDVLLGMQVTGPTSPASLSASTGNSSGFQYTVTGGDLVNFNGTVGLDIKPINSITDVAGNPLVIIEPPIDETFELDNSAPTLVSINPIDDATGVITEPVLTATFSEPVQFATGGEIIIQNITTGTPFGKVDAASGAITFSGNGFTIDPMAPFLEDNEYEVQIDATDLEDVAGNPFAGIDSGGWTFTTATAVDLELEMSVDNATPSVGDAVNFTFTLTNKGPGDATGVKVKALFPSGVSPTGVGSTTKGTYNFPPVGEWVFASPIVSGTTATLVLEATVNASGDYLFLAEVITLNEPDIDSTPNNGVDTNGNGNLIDDSGDEDDGDAEMVSPIPPCTVEIVTQPENVVVCEVEPHSFSVGATGNGALSYKWEVSTNDGLSWIEYPNANENILDVPQGAVVNADGWQFRVIVTSDNGTSNDAMDDCSATSETATLTVNPVPVVAITGNDSYCFEGNGVVLDAGAGFTSYLWSPGGETTQTITALEGSYTVEVSNEYGCKTLSEAFMVINNQPLVCNIQQDVLTTDHETTDGVATVNVTGGTGQFTYLWDNGETTQTATTLTYSMHSVTVTDSNGCETTCQIDMAKELYCWTNLVQNVSVRGGNDGAARVYGNGGFRPYTYLWSDGSTGELNTVLPVGTHDVTITDASGAKSKCSVTITEPNTGNCNDFTTSIEQEKLTTDHETLDGVATVYPKGGTGQYTYLWDNGETTQTATTITYGMHSVTVTDATGCISIAQIDIAKELYCWINLYTHVSVHGAKDGSAMVHGNGGYRPHTFKWDDGSTEQLNNNLGAGTHYVTVTDATGATSQCSITITEPNEEVCDGIDNDGDGQIDEGFDQDGDGIADCFDICDKGDDHVDMDNDGIPDACDDTICIKVEKPMTECYQTAVWDQQTCSWIISGEKPLQPMTECYQTAEWNGTTCTWDIIDGQRPEMPMTECYQMAAWNTQACSWDVIGDKPMEPMTECHQTAVWNSDNCIWDIIEGKPEMPLTLCYQTAVWSDQICDWEINGEKPLEPMTECYETATWNEATCTWDILDGQPEMPMTLCYQTAVWSDQKCDWEINGEKPLEPMTECYETATWNEATCEWDIEGVQPEMPMTQCQETAVWNELTCTWDIIENNNDCDPGTIDQCETAFARSADENVRSCFIDIPNVSGNRWGWTNVFPSTNGTYYMDLYAAAGQCTISNGALVGNVEVIYTDGAVEVTVSTLSGYKMTVAQLYVGTEILPTDNNGRFTTAPGQYPHQDTVEGDFNTFTFESVNVGNPGNFYVVLHADVCPNVTVPSKTASVKLELTAYPVPFKDYINLKIESPLNMNGTLSLYNGIGQQLQDFGTYTLKQGDNDINLNTGEIPIGLYFIRMTSVYGTETLKIIRK